MENTNKSRKYILKKSPVAKFVASALFILGSHSAIANVNGQITHRDNVNGRNIALTNNEIAQNSVINGVGSLTLTDKAKAINTQVNTSNPSAIFHLTDNSSAKNSKISHGLMVLSDQATALVTFVGLKKGEKPGDNKLPGKMYIRKDGKAQNTTISSGGVVRIENNGTAENTTVLKGGKLLITNEGEDIKLVGTIMKGGELILESDVTLEGETKILPNSTINTDGHKIKNNGDLHFAGKGREITATIEGSGSLTINNPKDTFILKGVNIDTNHNDYSYSGSTNITAGHLKLSQAKFTNSTITGEKDTKLMLENSFLDTTVSGGYISVDIDGESTWHNRENSSIGNLNIHGGGNLNLSSYPIKIGALNIPDQPLANQLTINGDYHSDGGTLTFYSKLAGDDSETDRMIVEGNTSGHTKVKINNLGGAGAKTDLGILLIEVKGQSDGDFKQVGRNPAGAYEYFLRRGSEVDSRKNWYMISDAPSVDKKPMAEEKIEEAIPKVGNEGDKANKPNVNPPTTEKYSDKTVYELLATTISEILEHKEKEKTASANAFQTTAPTTEIENEPKNISVGKSPEATKNISPKDINVVATSNKPAVAVENRKNIPQKSYKPIYRPENGSYIANLSMARNLFTSDLENRSGNYKYKDAATGEWRTSSMWIQTQGGIKQFGKTVDQLNIKGKYYSIQLGGDVAQWDIGTQGSGRIGMLAGLAKATNHSKSNITGYYSNGSVNGYNLGVYATWLTDQQNKTGLYIDTLAQYSWFNNAVNGQELAEVKYKSSGFTSSIESGYTFNIGSTEQLSYFIQPNAKITWVGINAQTHTATNKDTINYTNRGQLITRIGAKTYLQTTNNSDQQFMPFIAVNWLHQNHNTGTQLSGKSVENSSKNSAELKIGVESKIDQRLHAWANINHQIGNYNTSDTNALVGIKYAF
ncbi:autotransporter outer membrane beta-barrel domain-containing protein [Yersinia artesiana]|uniref:autotransporter outer membrane beta-barrel domain-containing protein n=1 Tax=Yersinia artesiana TaxID=2890315 RepID=UPI0015837F25|nr:autotransporter outer membrane beta-barrel domain-containing protein [Yersinia artesiana]